MTVTPDQGRMIATLACVCCGRPASERDARGDRCRIHFRCWEEHHCGPDTPWPPDHECEVEE